MVKAVELARENKYILPFARDTFTGKETFTFIGSGHLGGKARRLAIIKEKFAQHCAKQPENVPILVEIPRLTVITTQYFDLFMKQNKLNRLDFCNLEDTDIVGKFLEARLPEVLTRDLEAFLAVITTPIAVRSSSFMEDSLDFPFAGIYKTKMLPNNQPNPAVRLRKLTDAVKYVYASTFFKSARCSMTSTAHDFKKEKMAVIIQEMIGLRHQNRFYPNISGVARSYNFYPSGHAKPGEGVVSLALGLGKSIVEGGAVWTYSPEYPEINPPYGSINQLLKQTQLDFWAVNMDRPSAEAPGEESEFLVRLTLQDAEQDNTLGYIASTYDYGSDTIRIGIEYGGSRIINFAPILRVDLIPVNQQIKALLKLCEDTFKFKVEMEFAITFGRAGRTGGVTARLYLLQVRPIAVCNELVELEKTELSRELVLAASENVMGNGCIDFIKDIVYVVPETFDSKYSLQMADEIEGINRQLTAKDISYLLVGFGRWGSSMPSVGIPVTWGHICAARTMVEISLTGLTAELSQGSHFFHNISSLRIPYFSLKKDEKFPVDWKWLEKQTVIHKGKYVKHVRLNSPLAIKVDGRSRKGIIFK
ncbi:MAG: hypothetical protein GY950_35240 [bacterium]|nr:hypothetical protein [bacterium]